MGSGKLEASPPVLVRRSDMRDHRRMLQEDSHSRYQQRLRQPLYDRVQQRRQVGLRVQAAAEVDQRLAVVEALLVECAVHPCLDAPLEGIEGEAEHQDRDNWPVEARV